LHARLVEAARCEAALGRIDNLLTAGFEMGVGNFGHETVLK